MDLLFAEAVPTIVNGIIDRIDNGKHYQVIRIHIELDTAFYRKPKIRAVQENPETDLRTPGTYFFMAKHGEIELPLYVGKTNNLHQRLFVDKHDAAEKLSKSVFWERRSDFTFALKLILTEKTSIACYLEGYLLDNLDFMFNKTDNGHCRLFMYSRQNALNLLFPRTGSVVNATQRATFDSDQLLETINQMKSIADPDFNIDKVTKDFDGKLKALAGIPIKSNYVVLEVVNDCNENSCQCRTAVGFLRKHAATKKFSLYFSKQGKKGGTRRFIELMDQRLSNESDLTYKVSNNCPRTFKFDHFGWKQIEDKRDKLNL